MEADFAREYPSVCGGDLREALWGSNPIGVRRFMSLVRGLPPRSTVVRDTNTDGKEWGTVEELLSLVAEELDMANRIAYAAAAGKRAKMWKPLEVPRPYTRRPTKPSTPSELRKFFKAQGTPGIVSYTGEDS